MAARGTCPVIGCPGNDGADAPCPEQHLICHRCYIVVTPTEYDAAHRAHAHEPAPVGTLDRRQEAPACAPQAMRDAFLLSQQELGAEARVVRDHGSEESYSKFQYSALLARTCGSEVLPCVPGLMYYFITHRTQEGEFYRALSFQETPRRNRGAIDRQLFGHLVKEAEQLNKFELLKMLHVQFGLSCRGPSVLPEITKDDVNLERKTVDVPRKGTLQDKNTFGEKITVPICTEQAFKVLAERMLALESQPLTAKIFGSMWDADEVNSFIQHVATKYKWDDRYRWSNHSLRHGVMELTEKHLDELRQRGGWKTDSSALWYSRLRNQKLGDEEQPFEEEKEDPPETRRNDNGLVVEDATDSEIDSEASLEPLAADEMLALRKAILGRHPNLAPGAARGAATGREASQGAVEPPPGAAAAAESPAAAASSDSENTADEAAADAEGEDRAGASRRIRRTEPQPTRKRKKRTRGHGMAAQ